MTDGPKKLSLPFLHGFKDESFRSRCFGGIKISVPYGAMKSGMNKKKSVTTIFCAVAWTAAIILSAHAGVIKTGANLSGEARAKIELKKPNSTFETQALPPAPDYGSGGAWAALPWKADKADLAPSNTRYPEAQAIAGADVFFIHPTTATTARDKWNTPIDDGAAIRDVDNVLGFCASAFNAAAKVYAPRYRAANIYAFFDDKTASGLKAVDLAYRDVERAFLHYIQSFNRHRPFILAGHSQGSIHGLRLLQEHIMGTPLMDRMVAAYLIGGTIPQTVPGIAPSRSATDTGVLIGWNTYIREGDPGIFTDGLVAWIDGSYTTMAGRPLIQVNPLSWKLNGPGIPASSNPGSLPFLPENTGSFALVPAVCGADASGKVLIINKPGVPGFDLPDAPDMPVLTPKYGDYHDFDYTLFYESLRKNAIERVRFFSGYPKGRVF